LAQNGSEGRSDGRAALKAYASELLESRQGAHIAAVTVSLQRDNTLATDPMSHLGSTQARHGEPAQHHRARVMGEWLGIVGSAVQTRIGSRDANAAMTSLVFTGTVDTLKELAGAFFPALRLPIGLLAAAVKPGVNATLLQWRTALAREDRGFTQNLFEGALPHHANGVPATAPWVTTLNAHFAASLQRQ
jgi:hypothetical protein